MLIGLRPFHNTEVTRRMVSKLPEWMSIRNPNSVGSRFLDSIVGIELDTLERNMSIYGRYSNIVDSPTDSITNLYDINVDYTILSGNIKPLNTITLADGSTSIVDASYDIELIEDELSFFSNYPTRIERDLTIHPSGYDGLTITSGITGIEWFSIEPTGYIALQQDINPVDPSSILYYNVSYIDNNISNIPYSGDNTYAIGTIGLDENASYEILAPELSGSIISKYPLDTWVYFDLNGVARSSGVPPSGTDSYNAFYSTYYSSYIDPITNEKIYFYKAYNNPYGSGVYNQSDVTLSNTSLSDMNIFDIMNLDPSGVPYNIPESGRAVYYFSEDAGDGIWEYMGYEEVIPEKWMPLTVKENHISELVSGVKMFDTTWRLLPSSGYIDNELYPYSGTFTWVDGGGASGNVLRFTNPISKYQAEYKYTIINEPGALSAVPKDSYNMTADSDSNLLIMDGYNRIVFVPIERTLSDPGLYKTDCLTVRPGNSVLTKVTFNRIREYQWVNASGSDKTIQFTNHNIGYTDELGGF